MGDRKWDPRIRSGSRRRPGPLGHALSAMARPEASPRLSGVLGRPLARPGWAPVWRPSSVQVDAPAHDGHPLARAPIRSPMGRCVRLGPRPGAPQGRPPPGAACRDAFAPGVPLWPRQCPGGRPGLRPLGAVVPEEAGQSGRPWVVAEHFPPDASAFHA